MCVCPPSLFFLSVFRSPETGTAVAVASSKVLVSGASNSQAPTPPPALTELSKQHTRRHSARQPSVYEPLNAARKSRATAPGCTDSKAGGRTGVWVWGQDPAEEDVAEAGAERGEQHQKAKGADDVPDVTVTAAPAASGDAAGERQKMFVKSSSNVSSCRCVCSDAATAANLSRNEQYSHDEQRSTTCAHFFVPVFFRREVCIDLLWFGCARIRICQQSGWCYKTSNRK